MRLWFTTEARSTPAASDTLTLNLKEFTEIVLIQNLEIAIEAFEISAAQAAVTAARVFENPELEIILPAFDRDDFNLMPRNIEFEIEVPLELGRKRTRRIQLARAELEATRAGFEDFLREFQSEIALLYVEVARQQRLLAQIQDTRRQFDQLLTVMQQLFDAGEISEIELIQTRLEARSFHAEYLDERAVFAELMQEVYVMMGAVPIQSIRFEDGLRARVPGKSLDELTLNAMQHRTDLVMADRNLAVNRAALRLAQSERIPTIGLIAGYHNEEGIRPMPGFRAVYAGVSVPLSFSSFNRGEVREARAFVDQGEVMVGQKRLAIGAEIDAAYKRLQFMDEKRTIFSESIIADAERVRDAILYSYQRGEASLLEVLEAQRTLNEIYVSYYDALSDYAEAIIALSAASGLWLLEFEP